tara:strand:- start:2043 stop:4055 length:2013 start_codon:yes stop_codon:yes gene_type:complete
MVRPDSAGLFEAAIASGKTIIMADNSQESRYNIADVEQQFSVGFGQVRSTYANTFTIKITEPNGTTFLESIALSARQLNIENHLLARYFITIEFIGRVPDGSAKRHPLKFIYPVVFQNIQMQVDAGGAEYTISAVENGVGAFSYLEQVIKSQITLEAATVGEFVSEFMKKYEKSLENDLMFNWNAAYKDEYSIEWDSETGTDTWQQWKIQQAAEGLTTLGPSKIGDKIHFTIPNGSNLSDIIGMMLQATEEYKKIVTDSGGFMKTTPGEPSSQNLDEFPVFYKVIPRVEFGPYDPLRGDYVKIITFKIKKHIVVDRIMDSVQYGRGITDTTIQNTRVNKMFEQDLLRKRYDYIFTGLNTEIMQLDLKFDHQYYEISVVGNGQVGDANKDASTAGQSAPTLHEGVKALKKSIVDISRNLTRLIDQRSSRLPPPEAASVSRQIEELEEQRSTLQNELETKLAEFAEATRGGGGVGKNGNYLTSEEAKADISMRLRFAGDVVDDSDIYGPENDGTGGAMQFGAVKSNLENSADMLKIEMGIRGDPYWLGMPSSFYRSNVVTKELADYEKGGLLFFLNVKFPIDENEAGRRIPRDDYTLSGTYRVIDVTNRFTGGMFTQHLGAVRDLATNTSTVLGTLQSPQIVADVSLGTSNADAQTATNTDPAQIQESGGPR